ncbi:hypothetical protein HJFPF1_00033 [Paramyrothecium foliicola]|nr:hypothetical protein HJFPF1_00033 [Paramyrothecium foliicola]
MEQNQEQEVPSRCAAPEWNREDPDQSEISAILKGLKQDLSLMGVLSLGKDGVLRSLTADRHVIDAIGLKPRQISALLARVPGAFGDADQYAGVDGQATPKDQWHSPDKGLLPPPLSEEDRRRTNELLRSNPELFQKRINELKEAWDKSD